MRLHVSRRQVTIMFADIKDFTSIAEKLSKEDLLVLLTRYLSLTTATIEAHQGVVAEIMGDGLLVFWNTPDDVDKHEAKACASALAQQALLGPLNQELEQMSLPSISVRIGLHTGSVLTGNIGSQTKMKFGCIGDAMNLASRLEGLCKVYGSEVLCSAKTRNALPPEAGFVCRKLDLVQVKGKSAATSIYDLFNVASPSVVTGQIEEKNNASFGNASFDQETKSNASFVSSDSEVFSGSLQDRIHRYETALAFYQRGFFTKACETLESLIESYGEEDKAVNLLLERSRDNARDGALSKSELAAWRGVYVLNEK
eukprot:TRINITY_DN26480_c0_g1_i1.p1 TRINITY_DN26480_c0_g1~~TRINITY_DN26480_c0_g1_i1.p1  ORF type:complete len:361 (+),score=80.05 TRINITY_DN26480_c0_g1_i1:146-1084(+)